VAQHYTEQKPGIDVIAADTPVWVDADADRVQIVLRNVLDNAVKYSAHQRRPVRLVLTTEDNWIKIEVHDFGTGIPAPDIEHIFEPFYRVDKSRSTGGYGLGLSLCKKIMQAHGGDITVRIEPDVETVFTIRLPVS
jgi:two-component system sensor histidine kinase SenX3